MASVSAVMTPVRVMWADMPIVDDGLGVFAPIAWDESSRQAHSVWVKDRVSVDVVGPLVLNEEPIRSLVPEDFFVS